MHRIPTLFWFFSLIAFLAFLIYTNLYLPTYVNVIGENNLLEKAYYFYILLAFGVLLNGSLLLLGGALQFVPSFLMPVPKKVQWMGDERRRKKLYLNLKAWLKGLGICFNLFLIASIIDIYDNNDADIYVPTAWMFVLVGVLTLAWFVTYFFWLRNVPTDEELKIV
jgi:hypothetical protein